MSRRCKWFRCHLLMVARIKTTRTRQRDWSSLLPAIQPSTHGLTAEQDRKHSLLIGLRFLKGGFVENS